ncbi:hypothetical protein O181_032784 [Austropuccinia psidii MF-1]|uniref:Uncharacterized protein n=1 Tax=Austropuccinia psidii MF-1 TaxID=1389203 RepID=A0A9Q3CY23_9BASI|nr:hypothetical protein [Austropuccinia psidii MF-1]
MTHTLTYHSIENVQLRHHHVGRGIGPYAPAPAQAHAHAYPPALARAHAHANSTTPHLQYCVGDSTSVIHKMTIPWRQSPFMDDLVKSNPPPLHQDWLKDLFDVCMWKQAEIIIHRKIPRKSGGDLEHAVKRRTTEKYSAQDIINILEEVTTRTRIGSNRVNLKTRFNTPWKDSVEKNHKENPDNIKYKSADVMRKCHICQSTTNLANTCPKKGKITEIDIEKEHDVERYEVHADN